MLLGFIDVYDDFVNKLTFFLIIVRSISDHCFSEVIIVVTNSEIVKFASSFVTC